jgi:hypothetical protein
MPAAIVWLCLIFGWGCSQGWDKIPEVAWWLLIPLWFTNNRKAPEKTEGKP